MSFIVACSCGKKLRAREEQAGKTVRCPACKEIFVVSPVTDEAQEAQEKEERVLSHVGEGAASESGATYGDEDFAGGSEAYEQHESSDGALASEDDSIIEDDLFESAETETETAASTEGEGEMVNEEDLLYDDEREESQSSEGLQLFPDEPDEEFAEGRTATGARFWVAPGEYATEIVVLDGDKLCHSRVSSQKFHKTVRMVSNLEACEDAYELLPSTESVALSSIVGLKFDKNRRCRLDIRYAAENGDGPSERTKSLGLGTHELREKVFRSLQQELGPEWEASEVSSSPATASILPLVVLLVVGGVGAFLTAAAYGVASIPSFLSEWQAALESVQPMLVGLAGGALTLLCLMWWIVRLQNPAKISVLEPR